MKTSLILKTTLSAVCLATLATGTASASVIYSTDSFGSGADSFGIQFTSIGNAGNAGKNQSAGVYGRVDYNYRMGATEVSQDWINRATTLGMTNVTAGAWGGSRPAGLVSWYESAAFVNWLNTTTGHQAAYDLAWTGTAWTMNLWSSGQAWQTGGENLYRHKGAYYFLPSENEWYKSAFHKNDGVTANFWDYATGSDTSPLAVASGTGIGSVVYGQGFGQGPADVTLAGGLSPYGTMGQGGNMFEWVETAVDGGNDVSSEDRALRGGYWAGPEFTIRSSTRGVNAPTTETSLFGFRVASIEPVPEPTGTLAGLLCLGLAAMRRRRSRDSQSGSTAPQ